MRKSILSLAAFLLCLASKAQFSLAMVGGPQSNAVSPAFTLLPDTVLNSTSRYTGLNFGFIGHVRLNRSQMLFLRTGVLYSAKGSQTFQQFDTANVNLTDGKHLLRANTRLKTNYIDVPVNLLLKLPVKGKTKFLLGGGITASLFYNGSTDLSTIKVYKVHPDSTTRTEFNQTIAKDLPVGKSSNKYDVLHWSANALTGFEFGRVFLTVNYNRGLTNFYKTDTRSFRHSTIGFHLGIYLGNPQPLIKDKDEDGIVDSEDLCPDKPGPLLTKGCPDKDGDGIADQEDRCPDQAGSLENHGCPVLDRDNDGIRDEDDQCPDQAGPIQNKGCPLFDKDDDGVLDVEDKCPDVPGLKKYHGCPVPDTDQDGINDEEDKCPDTAGLKKYNGCPVPDSDGDGVNDEEDQCPSVAGSKDNHGCPEVTEEQQQKISYAAKQIRFGYSKADLSPSSHAQLDEVVEILKNNPTLNIRVEGHTSGPDTEFNRVLSQKRAESVKNYFIEKGIAPERVLAEGFGSAKPLSKAGNKKENSEDRRVELIIF